MSAANSTGFSMNDPLALWLRAMSMGLPGDNLPVLARPAKIYSRKNVLVGNAAPREFRFFDESAGPNIQNLPQPNQFGGNTAFALQSIRFGFVYGLDRQGRRLGLASPSAAQKLLSAVSAGATAAAGGDLIRAQWRAAEVTRALLQTPIVTFKVQETTIWTVQGLTSLPDGKAALTQAGLSQASTSATAAGTSDIVQTISNGAPFAGNAWTFGVPFPLPANQTFDVLVEWPQPVDFAEADIGPLEGQTNVVAGTLTCELQGYLAIPN